MDRAQAQANLLLKIRTGSQLYGTARPDSDEDFAGVFAPLAPWVYGMRRVEQVDCGHVAKDAAGKNTAEAVDFTAYEVRKFARLALDNNPNVLELLFADAPNVVHVTPLGQRLLDGRGLFPHRGLVKRFVGYATSQRHKMRIRIQHYGALKDALAWLDEQHAANPSISLAEVKGHRDALHQKPPPGFAWKASHAQVGDQSYGYHERVKNVRKKVGARLASATNRTVLFERHGFDTKFASHLIRLLMECRELVQTGTLVFPLAYADELRAIREGALTMPEIEARATAIEDEIRAVTNSPLRTKTAFDEVDALVQDIVRDHLEGAV
ncbi:MAG: nucleotidyltransferase domain-containing protein [Bacteroidota bacterium]